MSVTDACELPKSLLYESLENTGSMRGGLLKLTGFVSILCIFGSSDDTSSVDPGATSSKLVTSSPSVVQIDLTSPYDWNSL